MSRLLKGMTYEDTFTENRMPTHSTSSDPCLDWFACAGSTRNWTEHQITTTFARALSFDPLLAMRILFWARDVRGGAGERRLFRVCLEFLNEVKEYQNYLLKNLHLVPEYGRWDDMFHLNNIGVLDLIHIALASDDGLAAKWLPRKGPFANKVRNFLELTPKEYRKLVVRLSKTVEQKMCAGEWNQIKYEHVPSVAMNKYRKAFSRNDNERFGGYITSVLKGETKINSSVLFPYQLYEAFRRREAQDVIEAQWRNLPNFMEGNSQRILPVCDVSGSMNTGYGSTSPMSVSVSLGIYISERNEGLFKDAFVTFSERPTIQYLKGNFCSRCHQLLKAHWDMNTNLEAVFKLLLSTATREEIAEDEMPNVILILSDMQFDRCVQNPSHSAMRMIRGMYRDAGYEVPTVVFWNLNARVDKIPVKFDESGTAIVSGCSPAILKSVLDGSIMNPREVMLRTVNAERYQKITV